MTTILGISLDNRIETAIEFQKIVTEYGCNIRTRIGLHSSEDGKCMNRGIVLLELCNDSPELIAKLDKRWPLQKMVF